MEHAHSGPALPADAAPADRRHFRILLTITLPLALSLVAEMAMGMTDTALLGGIGPDALAIGGLATGLFFTILAMFQSGLGAAGVVISRRLGEGRPETVAGVGVNALVFGVVLCLPCMVVLLLARQMLAALGEPAIIVTDSARFLLILLVALFPDLAVIGLLRSVLPALGAERLMMWTMPGMAVLNGVLNASLIHGWLGLPRMGLWGSATATALTGWIVAGALLVLVRRHERVRPHMRLAPFSWPEFWTLLRLGMPMVVSAGAEIVMFEVTSLRAGTLGTHALAAHQIALTVCAMTFMVSLALSQATNVRVSYWIGARDAEGARRTILVALGTGLAWTVMCATVLIVFPERVAALYLDMSRPENVAVIAVTATLLKIGGFYQIVDGLQAVTSGILRGGGDTVAPMLISVGGYGIFGLGGGGWLAFQCGFGVRGLWYGLAGGLAVVCALLGIRLGVLYGRLRRGELKEI